MKLSFALRLSFLAASAIPANLAFGIDEPPPTDITSVALEMHSSDTETFATFTGNVVVLGNDLKLTCDKLDVTTSRLGDKTATVGKLDKFKYMLATGKVHIIQGDREATCGRAEVFPREDKIILTEDPVIIDNGNSSNAAGDVITLFRGQRRAQIKNPHIILPPIKDLGFDKNEAPPGADSSASAGTSGARPADKPKTESTPAPAGPTPSK